MIERMKPLLKMGSSDVKQGSILSLVLFDITGIILDESMEGVLIKYAQDINLRKGGNAIWFAVNEKSINR